MTGESRHNIDNKAGVGLPVKKMNLFKRTLTDADGKYESWYVDQFGKAKGVPVEYWGPDEIEVPDERVTPKSD